MITSSIRSPRGTIIRSPPCSRASTRRRKSVKVKLAATPGQPDFAGVAHAIVPRQPPLVSVLERGDYRKPREVVSPAGLKAISAPSPDLGLRPDAPEGLRRQALARWLTDPRNPLTARVFVNRLWYFHFGQGLVETPSDFGFNGGRPSHPELLDHLASRFVRSGWDVKRMHRLIVTSAAYRQASQVRDDRGVRVDAENRLLWRANPRRLEGEAVRDAVLAVSGALNPRIGGPSFQDIEINRKGPNTNHVVHGARPGSSRRRSTAARSTACGRGREITLCSNRSTAPTRRS